MYVVVNIALAMFWYWLARVPKDRRAKQTVSVKQTMSRETEGKEKNESVGIWEVTSSGGDSEKS